MHNPTLDPRPGPPPSPCASLYFGEPVEGQQNPLDGRKAIASEGSGVFSYFIKIVPTRFYEGAEYTSKAIQAAQVA